MRHAVISATPYDMAFLYCFILRQPPYFIDYAMLMLLSFDITDEIDTPLLMATMLLLPFRHFATIRLRHAIRRYATPLHTYDIIAARCHTP